MFYGLLLAVGMNFFRYFFSEKLVLASSRAQLGNQTTTVRTFFGTPYGSPPMGGLRWKAPRPVAPWSAAIQQHLRTGQCRNV